MKLLDLPSNGKKQRIAKAKVMMKHVQDGGLVFTTIRDMPIVFFYLCDFMKTPEIVLISPTETTRIKHVPAQKFATEMMGAIAKKMPIYLVEKEVVDNTEHGGFGLSVSLMKSDKQNLTYVR